MEAMGIHMMALEMFGTSMLVFFMQGVWRRHLDTWPCPRIILTYHMCGLVEAMWVQMRALEMFGTLFVPVLFIMGVWKCHLDTWLGTRIILTHHM